MGQNMLITGHYKLETLEYWCYLQVIVGSKLIQRENKDSVGASILHKGELIHFTNANASFLDGQKSSNNEKILSESEHYCWYNLSGKILDL